MDFNMKIILNEEFYSIQGEGYTSGVPSVFVRLHGCNLSCHWCDTKYACNDSEYISIDVDTLISKVCSYKNHSHICITGGEPMLQKDALVEFINKLSSYRKIQNILIQTNGTLDIRPFLLPKVLISMDYKLESSGYLNKIYDLNLSSLREQDELKFVVADHRDFDISLDVQSKHNIHAKIVYSPVYPIMQYDALASMILESNIHCKLSLQIHKHIWPHIDRGV